MSNCKVIALTNQKGGVGYEKRNRQNARLSLKSFLVHT